MGNIVDDSLAVLDRLFLDRCLLAALRELRDWSFATQKTIWSLAAKALRQVAPPMGRRPRVEDAAAAFLLRPSAALLWAEEADRRARRVRSMRDIARLPLIDGVEQLSESRGLQSPSELSGLSMTFPYAHRPLVELVLSVPSHVFCAPHRPRAMMHDAIDDLLPERVRRRFSKGYAAPLLMRRARTAARDLRLRTASLAAVEGGYVDGARLQEALARLETGACRSLTLSRVIELERWIELCRRHRGEQLANPCMKGGESHDVRSA